MGLNIPPSFPEMQLLKSLDFSEEMTGAKHLQCRGIVYLKNCMPWNKNKQMNVNYYLKCHVLWTEKRNAWMAGRKLCNSLEH
jgi:hypothetical protein